MKLIELLDSLNININKELYIKLKKFRIGWITRNRTESSEHIDFLSSDLVGVYPILFSKDDVDDIFDILDIDGRTFKKDLKKVSDINPEFKNITEPIYVLMLYVMYGFNNSKLPNKIKDEARVISVNIFIFKMLSSILNHYYGNYNVSMSDATLTREAMHGNSLLVKFGSWNGVIQHFTEVITEDKGLHGKRLRKKFKVDDLTYVISNTKTSINSFVFNSNAVLLAIKDDTGTHSKNKAYVDGGENMMLQDHKNIHLDLTRTIRFILATGDLYNNDVIEVLYSTYVGLNKDSLVSGIRVIEELYAENPKELLEVMDKLFETTIYYLYLDKLHPPYSRNIVKIIEYLKNYYTSSRITDDRLADVKKYINKHMKKSIKRSTRRTVAISNTVMVYIFILTNIELHVYK